MILLVLLYTLFLFLAAYFLNAYVRKYFIYIGVLFSGISILALFAWNTVTSVFINGELGLSFFLIVMYAGAFPRASKISRKLRSVRKEYSILGFVGLLPHFILYLQDFLLGYYDWEWFGLIAAIIMIPLFITSFSKIKKQMDIKQWFKLQKLSYIVYGLLFVHLMLTGSLEHQIAYLVVFSLYFSLKVYNYLLKNNRFFKRAAVLSVFLVSIFTFTYLICADSPESTDTDTQATADDSTTQTSSDDSSSISTTNSDGYVDGTYTGTGTGYHGMTTIVDVTIEDGVITDIEIISYGSTGSAHGMSFTSAADTLVGTVLKEQTTDVDTISGATFTSNGILEAIQDAIDQYYDS